MRNLERRIGMLVGHVAATGRHADDPSSWTAERLAATLADIRPSSTPPTPKQRAEWRAREATDDGFRAVLEELGKLPASRTGATTMTKRSPLESANGRASAPDRIDGDTP